MLVSVIFLSACNSFNSDCPPNAQISWVDAVMINDIQYMHHFPAEEVPLSIERGNEVGKVTYQMADHACSSHQMQNGDAAFWEKGTTIYSIKGYPSAMLVLVGDKVYVASENSQAKTAGGMYPMDGLVKNIHIQSLEDGSRIHTFSHTSKEQFLHEWNQLKLEDRATLHKKGKFENESIFLEIELNNGVSFREPYWADTNVFRSGVIGNAEIKEVIADESSQLEKSVMQKTAY